LYTFTEPNRDEPITDVILIREGGRLSEQVFVIGVNVGEPDSGIRSATLDIFNRTGDYGTSTLDSSFIQVFFDPSRENVSLPLTLFSDNFPEGLEAFRATSSPVAGFPNFGPPTAGGAFATTEVRIVDNDRKVYNVSTSLVILIVCLQLLVLDLCGLTTLSVRLMVHRKCV
jgi:hypothetical protein